MGFVDNNNDVIIVDRLSCYTKFRTDSSFNARAVVETRRVRDSEECARECDYFRDSGRYQCNGFSISGQPLMFFRNCLLFFLSLQTLFTARATPQRTTVCSLTATPGTLRLT